MADPGNTKDKTIASGKDILGALRPAAEDLVNARSVNMAVKGLGKALGTKGGQADVLVIGDHGYVNKDGSATGVQQFGVNEELTPKNPAFLDQIAGFVRKKGTLVLTGCTIFDAKTVGAWQQYATDNDITIVGAASVVNFQTNNGCTAVWVILSPGATAPTITK